MSHLLVRCRFAFWRISRALPSFKYVLLFSINKYNKYRDICLVALLRILSCFLEASAALLEQVQVCILLAHQQRLVEP